MIFVWLRKALFFILRLVIPPPEEPTIPKIDVNAPCPSCGHRDGEISAVSVSGAAPQVQHKCKVCGARWFENPIHTPKFIKAPESDPKE